MFLISHFIEIIYIISTLWIGSSSIWIIIQFAKIILELSDRILFLIKCKNPTGWSPINFIKNSNSRKCVQSFPDLLLCPSSQRRDVTERRDHERHFFTMHLTMYTMQWKGSNFIETTRPIW